MLRRLDMLSPVIACLMVLGTPLPAPQFEGTADARTLRTFRVERLSSPASGMVYPAEAVEQGGMPLGGLGTGYLCLDPDGRLGKCSVFNRLPGPMVLGKPLLQLTVGDRRMTVATRKDGAGDVKQVHFALVGLSEMRPRCGR
jgi:hypothetical protein